MTRETWKTLTLQSRRDIMELVIEKISVDPVSGYNASHTPAEKRVGIRWR